MRYALTMAALLYFYATVFPRVLDMAAALHTLAEAIQ